MIRNLSYLLVAAFSLLVLLLAPGPPAEAQDPWRERRLREQVVAIHGPVARSLVETYGADVGCRAMFAVSWNVGQNLAVFHNSGSLGATPRPVELLMAIAVNGDVVAWYVMQHPELRNLDECDAFLTRPLDIALGVCSLEAKVAEMRVTRMRAEPQNNGWSVSSRNLNAVVGIAGLALLVGLFVWWKRRQRVSAVA
jgi:hypothetical protein